VRQTARVHARSALFDLYGDHLSTRDGWAPVASLVRLMTALEIAPAATRTAVSRMAREGWLEPDSRDGIRGYRATERAQVRLQAAWKRIYSPGPATWDGTWHVLVTEHVGDRSSRDRLAASLGYLGYARQAPQTWVAPRASDELAGALGGVRVIGYRAQLEGEGSELAAGLWDLTTLAREYRRFSDYAAQLRNGVTSDWQSAFAIRSALVHEWRKFLFTDPGLPSELLPDPWPGTTASAQFRQLTTRLRPDADRYVDQCLTQLQPPRER
jgi:phenylacetic acid degradation operon negative regulatory protein